MLCACKALQILLDFLTFFQIFEHLSLMRDFAVLSRVKKLAKVAAAWTLGILFPGRGPIRKIGGRYFERSSTRTEDLTTIVIPKGTTFLWFGAAYDRERRLIEELSCQKYSVPISQSKLLHPTTLLPPLQEFSGTAVILTALHADRYYHWMIDIVPKIEHFLREGLDPDYYLVCNETPFQREINQLLSLPEAKIVHPPASDCHMRFDVLYAVAPTRPHLGAYKHRVDFLKSLLLGETRQPRATRRLYLARGATQTRRVLNEQELEPFLLSRGFEIVLADRLTVAQQAKLFSEAELIIGPHGAAMTNLIFTPAGSRFVEFMPDGYYHPGFKRICEVNQIRYDIVTVDALNGHRHDIVLDETLIDRITRRADAS